MSSFSFACNYDKARVFFDKDGQNPWCLCICFGQPPTTRALIAMNAGARMPCMTLAFMSCIHRNIFGPWSCLGLQTSIFGFYIPKIIRFGTILTFDSQVKQIKFRTQALVGFDTKFVKLDHTEPKFKIILKQQAILDIKIHNSIV